MRVYGKVTHLYIYIFFFFFQHFILVCTLTACQTVQRQYDGSFLRAESDYEARGCYQFHSTIIWEYTETLNFSILTKSVHMFNYREIL